MGCFRDKFINSQCASFCLGLSRGILHASILVTLFAYVAHAQQDNIPPSIEHELITQSAETNRGFKLTAVVSDNDAVANAVIHYRISGESQFISEPMTPDLSGSGVFEYNIPARFITDSGVEYFITAKDRSGNEQSRGFSFDPLRLNAAPATEIVSDTSGGNTIWYVVGGVLALGALAALAGGSEDAEDGVVPLAIRR